MRLTVATEDGNAYTLDVDAEWELENVQALLESDSGITANDQLLLYNGRPLTDGKQTLGSYGITGDDMILLTRKQTPEQQQSVAGRDLTSDNELEQMRRQLLGNPQIMNQIRQTFPELADAAQTGDMERFRHSLAQFSAMQNSAKMQQERELALLNADPFNIEAQKKIEEAIRQQAVLENMEQAMENMPEAFGSVHMLYVQAEVNGHAVKAFVDSGAQATIMSPSCAERCGIMRLLDTRFAGMARGVGTAKILGRVHSAQIKMGSDLYLPCSFTIMEGRDVDLLFGLDMLKRHQACIDLKKDALVIQGREIRFLPEHELPKHFQDEALLEGSQPSAVAAPPAASGSQSAPFPGQGQSLGSAPASQAPASSNSAPAAAANTTSRHPESAIQSLIGLGVGRTEAIRLLDATNGNPEMAASLLFSGGMD